MKKIGITGPRGRLGSVLVQMGGSPLSTNLLDGPALLQEINSLNPDIIIHTAAYTDVDKAETEIDKAFQVNVHGLDNLRMAYKGKIVLLSTDYVFDGKRGPYREGVSPNPINWYGRSKMCAENLLFKGDVVVRTTGLYGNWSRPDFVQQILTLAKKGNSFPVLNKAITSPTNVFHLAEALLSLVSLIETGSYPSVINIAGDTVLSYYDFARMALEVFGMNPSLCQKADEVKRPATRPVRAGLVVDLAYQYNLPVYSAKEGLCRMLGARPR